MFRLTQSFISGFLICMASPLLFVSALSRASSCWKHLHRPLQALLQLHLINLQHAKEASVNSLQNGKYLFSTFSQPQLDGSGSVLCFSKHLHHFVAWKTARKICCFRVAEVGGVFLLMLHLRKVFFYMCLHLLRYTLQCTSQQNIVVIGQYLLRIFHFFAAQMQVLRTLL